MKHIRQIALPGILTALLLFIQSCEEPYEPEIDPTSRDVMVVEGHLHNGISSLKISKAVALNEEGLQPLANVSVRLESMDKSYLTYFNAITPGLFEADLVLDETKTYKLFITDIEGNIYESEEIPVINSPELEALEWDVQSGQLRILASTTADPDKSRFYRYDYVETWKYRSAFPTSIQYVNGELIYLPPQDRYYECYMTEESHNIVLANSIGLAQNTISKAVIKEISPTETARLNIRYSILVKQYAISREAYEFYDRLKANTEELGTLFDPQPSELGSNIHHTNGNKEVIGYVTAGNYSENRIFIHNSELSFEYYNNDFYFCTEVSLPPPMSPFPYTFFLETEDFLPIKRFPGVVAATSICVDCRLQGGVTEIPAFW